MKQLDNSHYQQRRGLLSASVQVAIEKVNNQHQCTYEHERDGRTQNDPLQLDNHGVWMGIEKHVAFMRPWAWCWTQSSETSECPTWRRGDAAPCRRLTLDGHGQEFSLGREAVLCVVFHELILVQVGVHNDVALRETYLCIDIVELHWDVGLWTYHFAATGVVYGKVVHHLGVQRCHLKHGFFMVWLISNRSLQSDEGAAVLDFNREQWRAKTSCMKWQKKNKNVNYLEIVLAECELAWACVILAYCPTLGRISSSGPIWRTLYWPSSEPWQSIPAPRPTSHYWGRTSTALCPCTAARPSSAPASLCCRWNCRRSWRGQEDGDHSVTRQTPTAKLGQDWRVDLLNTLFFLFSSPLSHKPSLVCTVTFRIVFV